MDVGDRGAGASGSTGSSRGGSCSGLGLDRHAIRYRLRGRSAARAPSRRLLGRASSSSRRAAGDWRRCSPAVRTRCSAIGRPAALWALQARCAGARIDVTVPATASDADAASSCHVSRVPPDERTVKDGIPVTTVPRTLLDLAAVLRPDQLERAIEQAEVLRLTDPLSLPAVLGRYPGRRGAATPAQAAGRRPDRRHRHPERARGALPRLRRRDRPAAAGGQRLAADRRPVDRGRLPLARRAAARSSSTADPSTPPTPPSSATAHAIAACRWRAGGRSASRGGSCTTTRERSRRDLRALLTT